MYKRLEEQLIKIRVKQLIVNEKYNEKQFKIPIHLALGHESLAVAVTENISASDTLVLSHRNIHYNLCKEESLSKVIDEYLGKASGLAKGSAGSMNLYNCGANIPYTSSILGNNLSVASGIALAAKVKRTDSVTFVVTGDGAMEEGAFYECLVFAKTYDLKLIIVIENNGWSLATKIEERRCKIDVEKICQSLSIDYVKLKGNDTGSYTKKVVIAKAKVIETNTPLVIECELHSLGDWIMTNEANPNGKYINYHAGPAPEVKLSDPPIIKYDNSDPVYVLKTGLGEEYFRELYESIISQYEEYQQ